MMTAPVRNIFISAGDLSGDLHAAELARAIKDLRPGVRIAALGGKNLAAAADELLENLVDRNAFGFWQPIVQFFKLKKLFDDRLKPSWDRSRPDAVVLVDYYGFNIHVGREARRRGIPVFYFVGPQVWASRRGRIESLKRCVRKMLVILPFEEKLYRDAGVPVAFVGHPLIDRIPETAGEASGGLTVGLFPGSRRNVLKRHLPILLETGRIIREATGAEIKIFAAGPFADLSPSPPFPVVTEKSFDERRTLSCAVTTSGTVSLENALLGIPMVVMYRLSGFNYMLAKWLVKVPYITMVNILLDRPVVTELIQDRATPELIARETVELLKNSDRHTRMKDAYAEVRALLGKPGVSRRAAEIILADLGEVKST